MKSVFGTDFSLFVGDKPLDQIPSSFFVGEKPAADEPLTEMTFTTTLQFDEPETKLTDEQVEKLTAYWAEKIERDLMDALIGRSTEFSKSLRAAGVKV
jgi:hypothetical protein